MKTMFLMMGVAGCIVMMLVSIWRVYLGRRAGEAWGSDYSMLYIGAAAVSGVVPCAILLLPHFPIPGAIVSGALLAIAIYCFARTPKVLR